MSFPKVGNSKLTLKALLEFELAYYDAATYPLYHEDSPKYIGKGNSWSFLVSGCMKMVLQSEIMGKGFYALERIFTIGIH